MKSLLFIIQLMLTIFMVSSCNKANPVGPSSGQQIWPLKVGDTWAYRLTYFDTTGAVNDTANATLVITSDTLFDGDTWYQINWQADFYTNKSDGLWMTQFQTTPNTVPILPQLLWKYPANAGDSYDSVTVESTNTSVTIPQGTYICYDYRDHYNSKPVSDNYLCPGVGRIATDFFLIRTQVVYIRNGTQN